MKKLNKVNFFIILMIILDDEGNLQKDLQEETKLQGKLNFNFNYYCSRRRRQTR